MAEDEISRWIRGLARGDEAAAQAIWQRYSERLIRLAQRRLEGLPRRIADEEDVVLSAMHSFLRGAAAGRYPQLADREDLWHLLVTITSHKAIKQARRQRAQKRGGGIVRGDSAFTHSSIQDRSTSSGENGVRSCRSCPGCPPGRLFRFRFPRARSAARGGLTMSLDGGLEEVDESFRAAPNCFSSSAILANAAASCFSNSATRSASRAQFVTGHG